MPCHVASKVIRRWFFMDQNPPSIGVSIRSSIEQGLLCLVDGQANHLKLSGDGGGGCALLVFARNHAVFLSSRECKFGRLC